MRPQASHARAERTAGTNAASGRPGPPKSETTRADAGLLRLADRLTGRSSAQSHANFFLPYLRSGTRLLECGCDNGRITMGLAEYVAPGPVTATDRDPANIETARSTAARYGITNITVTLAANRDLPFPDDHFDAAFAHGILSGMRNPSEAIGEIRRVVRSGGFVGIRDIDLGGTIIFPDSPLIARSLSIIERLMAQSGGNPRMGRHLAECLHNEGLQDVKLSASYQCEEPCGESHEAYEVMASVLTESPNMDLAVDMGWASRDDLTRMAAAWRSIATGAVGYFATAFCEVVGQVD